MRKSVLTAVLCALMLFATGALAADETVKIGIVGPTSGSLAYTGTLMQKGGLLAVDEINKAGGVTIGGKKMKVEAFHLDDGGKPAESVAATEKLVTQDKAVFIIGPYLSSAALADLEVTGRYGITQMTPIAVADAVTKGHPHMFRNIPNQTMQTTAMSRWMLERSGCKSFALFLQNDDYGRGAAAIFAKLAKEKNIPVVAQEYANLGDTDFSAQLTKIKGLNPDGLFVVANVPENAMIVKQARTLGLTQKIFGLGGFANQRFVELAGPASEGVMHVSYWEPDPKNEKSMKFAKAMKDFSNMEPEMFSAATYDAVYIALKAIEKAGCATQKADCQEKIQKALREMDYMGVQGRTTFDADGQGQLCLYVVKVEGGKRQIVEQVCPQK